MSSRTRIRRLPERALTDREAMFAILDEALVCHVGIVREDGPFVVPTLFGRIGETIYLHGSVASGNLRTMRSGTEVCITATIVDGIVVARSLFNSSMNYRSVVLFGRTRAVTETSERDAALKAVADHVLAGRWEEARQPNRTEDLQTAVVAVDIDEMSAKVRAAGVGDEPDDLGLGYWAGVLPLRITAGDPIPEPDLEPGIEVPGYLSDWSR